MADAPNWTIPPDRWNELRDQRKAHGGAFNWFMQCREHGVSGGSKFWCLSCDMIQEHNEKIWQELAREFGWLLYEPAGDVPMARRAGAS
jgi:hypothetical protein